jgi:uncharacterized repeat protein (TIGR02543 family)
LGGSGDDEAWALAIAGSDVYVAGVTESPDFPNTSSGAQASIGGDFDAFVAQLNSTLTSNLRSTYLGGSGDDWAFELAIAGSDVYVAGVTGSTDFPNTGTGAQASYGGGGDAFVAQLNATLTSNLRSTYLGGSGYDEAWALAIAGSDVYVAGRTASTDFPKISGGARPSYGGGTFDAFVARLTADLAASFTLSISPTPTGGNVTSSPPGINCGSSGSTCSASFPSGITVTLMATSDTGYIFVGWSGDCIGSSATITVTMDSNKTCTATFQLQLVLRTLTITGAGTGSGTVTASGINCSVTAGSTSGDCNEAYAHGTVVTLTATPASGSVFVSWGGDPDCTDGSVTMDDDKTCTATFQPICSLLMGLLWGDVDCDGDVDAVDALKILRHVVRLAVSQEEPCPDIGSTVTVNGTPRLWGDVDGDGDVDAVDALQILRHVVRLPVAQRPGTPPIGSRVLVVLPG